MGDEAGWLAAKSVTVRVVCESRLVLREPFDALFIGIAEADRLTAGMFAPVLAA